MTNNEICSFYTHGRFIILFNVIFENPTLPKELKNIIVELNEELESLTSIKRFKLSITHPLIVSFSGIFLNYTLYDGLNYKNGLLVKYYSNNNFIGKPLYITRIPSSMIGSNELNSNWYKMHTEFRDFSVKMTTLMYIPSDSGKRLTFVTGFSSRFQLFINN